VNAVNRGVTLFFCADLAPEWPYIFRQVELALYLAS